jgi:Na+-translocating ferredoxin:NAD+ oxidoreductase RnfD subunit
MPTGFSNPLNKLDIYSWMIVALAIFSAAGAYTFGWQQTLLQTIIAVAAANAFDILAKYFKTGEFRFTKSATVTGLFIGQLLPLSSEFYLPLIAAAVAIASKILINIGGRHVFNPTLFSLLVLGIFFSSLPSWWGSFAFPTQEFPHINLAVVIILGLIITIRQRRHDLVWPFIGAFMLFNFVGSALIPSAGQLSVPIDSTILYAAFFMLVEPKTSPLFRNARIAYGILAAAFYVAFSLFLPDYNLIGMVLAANLFVLPLDKYLRGRAWPSS